jgi:flagellar biosynthesis protein FlhG
MDQAQTLREYMQRYKDQYQYQYPKKRNARFITITSGKGGVGKSNFTLNFALGLQTAGKKVMILDMDMSTANINILMGVTPRFSLIDVLYQKKQIWDVIQKGTYGIEYISGGLEIQDLMDLDQNKLWYFWSQIQELQTYADFILLDTGAGISKELVDFILASDETIIVTTPEPTAIADSYAVLKTVVQFTRQVPKFHLMVNRAHSYREAAETSRSLMNACDNFLKLRLYTLGFLMEDDHIGKSVRSQVPFFIAYPNCGASKTIKQMVNSYLPDIDASTQSISPKGIRGFFEKIISLGKTVK